MRTSAPSALDAAAPTATARLNSSVTITKRTTLSGGSTTPTPGAAAAAAAAVAAKMESSPQLAAKRSALSATLKKLNSATATPTQPTAPPQARKSLHQHLQAAKAAAIAAAAASGSAANAVTPLNNRRAIKAGGIKRENEADVQQMHTFTIVNINDIINQKDDVVIEQTSTLHAAQAQAQAQADRENRNNNNNNTTQTGTGPVVRGRPRREIAPRADSDVDYQPGADSEELGGSDDDEHNRGPNSRRKAQHTILSERMKAVGKPVAGADGGTAPKLLNTQYRGGAVATITRQQHNGDKPAPRILNSTLCRNASQLEAHPQIHTIKRSVGGENNLNSSNNSNHNVIRTYNRVGGVAPNSHKTAAGAGAAAAQLGPGGAILRRQQPPPKTVISHQVVPGGQTRRVRKITCYETWFVIKLQDEKAGGGGGGGAAVAKTELAFSLVRLGNGIAGVALPADTWTYKVSLQRRRDADANATDGEVYTGDLHDVSIPERDRWQYAPTNIMFRRSAASAQAQRMQFDRAVIFKNNAFYINIDGKNVRLLGAPMKLDSLEEVETLLQIVDDVTLNSPLVEVTAYA